MSPTFHVEFTETAWEHLDAYRQFEVNIIMDAIKAQLPHQALEESRNRKRLRDNPLAD